MRERYNLILRLVCLALAGLVLVQISRLALRRDARGRIDPGLPIVQSEFKSKSTNAPAAAVGSPALPPRVQAMIDKIKNSELLGPNVKPPPMALLGIAGKDVILRAPSGQTGMIREGEELGGVKLIRIGTNRVIVEVDQQQKELTIFSGFGSQPLLSPQKKEKSEPLP